MMGWIVAFVVLAVAVVFAIGGFVLWQKLDLTTAVREKGAAAWKSRDRERAQAAAES